MTDKERLALYLFDEIGNIDDSIIAGAEMSPVSRAQSNGGTRGLIKALSVCAAAVVILVSVPTAARRFAKADNASLTETLISYSAQGVEEIGADRLLDGEAKLIWQKPGEDLYYTIALSADEEKALSVYSRQSRQLVSGIEEALCEMWICDERGNVSSPYLKSSAGNIYAGKLFDYLPEVIPTAEFDAYVKKLIKQKTS